MNFSSNGTAVDRVSWGSGSNTVTQRPTRASQASTTHEEATSSTVTESDSRFVGQLLVRTVVGDTEYQDRRVRWDESVVDNENLQRKKSKSEYWSGVVFSMFLPTLTSA